MLLKQQRQGEVLHSCFARARWAHVSLLPVGASVGGWVAGLECEFEKDWCVIFAEHRFNTSNTPRGSLPFRVHVHALKSPPRGVKRTLAHQLCRRVAMETEKTLGALMPSAVVSGCSRTPVWLWGWRARVHACVFPIQNDFKSARSTRGISTISIYNGALDERLLPSVIFSITDK